MHLWTVAIDLSLQSKLPDLGLHVQLLFELNITLSNNSITRDVVYTSLALLIHIVSERKAVYVTANRIFFSEQYLLSIYQPRIDLNMHYLSRIGYSERKILLKMTKLNSRFFARLLFFFFYY